MYLPSLISFREKRPSLSTRAYFTRMESFSRNKLTTVLARFFFSVVSVTVPLREDVWENAVHVAMMQHSSNSSGFLMACFGCKIQWFFGPLISPKMGRNCRPFM